MLRPDFSSAILPKVAEMFLEHFHQTFDEHLH